MRQAEKMEIITIVEQSQLSVKETLKELGIPRSTFYQWYKQYLAKGYEGLASNPVLELSAAKRKRTDRNASFGEAGSFLPGTSLAYY